MPTRIAPSMLNRTSKVGAPHPITLETIATKLKMMPKVNACRIAPKSTSIPIVQKKTGTRRLAVPLTRRPSSSAMERVSPAVVKGESLDWFDKYLGPVE